MSLPQTAQFRIAGAWGWERMEVTMIEAMVHSPRQHQDNRGTALTRPGLTVTPTLIKPLQELG